MNELNTIQTPARQDLRELFNTWIMFLDASDKTVETYTRAVTQLLKYLSSKGIKTPQKADLLSYKEHLASAGKKPSTITAYIMAAKQFFKWTEEEGLYPDIARNVKGVKVSQEHKKDALTKAQAKRLLQAIDRSTNKGKRDYAIIVLMITGGIREIEISRADIDDVRAFGDHNAIFVQGKGKTEKDEPVILSEATEAALIDYVRSKAPVRAKDPLFTSTAHRNAGERLTTKSISRLVKDYLKEAGIDSERITAHSLRHTAATEALKAGATIQEARQFMRHSNINTTLIYAHNLEKQDNPCSNLIDKSLFK